VHASPVGSLPCGGDSNAVAVPANIFDASTNCTARARAAANASSEGGGEPRFFWCVSSSAPLDFDKVWTKEGPAMHCAWANASCA